MTYQELESSVLQLSQHERLRLLAQITRSLQQDLVAATLDRAAIIAEAAHLLQSTVPAESSLYRVIGIGAGVALLGDDEDVQAWYAEYLTRKYLH